MEDRLRNGKKLRWLNIIDEYTRECIASIPRRSWRHQQIIVVLTELFVLKGCPAYIRSDNGSEFTANMLKQWLQGFGVTTAYIEPDSPWENGYCESFNSKMQHEFLNGKFLSSHEAIPESV